MQANELRIGNIVEWNRKPFKVCSISMDIVENELWSKPLQEIHPIPLTEEILTEWCGYKREVEDFFVNDANADCSVYLFASSSCRLAVGYDEYAIGEIIEYLHQLQNLYFALSGEELQIKLP